MNRKILSLMTATLILMAAFTLASCKKDKNDSGGGTDPDNPYLGTWVSEDDDATILDVAKTTWTVKYDGYIFLKGSYTYKGNTAALKVTFADEDYIDLEVGDEGTAKVSGKKLTVTFYGEDEVFIKESGGGGGGEEVYTEPYLKWGSSIADVKKYEKRTLEQEEGDFLVYKGENKDVLYVLYDFDYEELYLAGVWLNNTSNIEKRVMDFLKGKYEYLGEQQGMSLFMSSDEKTYIGFYYDDDEDYEGWWVEYIDASYADKSPFPMKNIKKSILIK